MPKDATGSKSRTGPEPLLRAQSKAERRQRILEAAVDLFSLQGFHRTSTRQIAEAAGSAEGTIFNYFPTKKDLLVAAILYIVEEYFAEEMEPLPTDDVLQLFRETFRPRLELGLRQTERIRFILSELLINQEMRQTYFEAVVLRLTELVEQPLKIHIAEGRLRPCNTRIAAGVMIGAFLTFLLVAALDEERRLLRHSADEISEELAGIFLYGLQPDQEG
jgi:AcrR family transcriptional regulator